MSASVSTSREKPLLGGDPRAIIAEKSSNPT